MSSELSDRVYIENLFFFFFFVFLRITRTYSSPNADAACWLVSTKRIVCVEVTSESLRTPYEVILRICDSRKLAVRSNSCHIIFWRTDCDGKTAHVLSRVLSDHALENAVRKTSQTETANESSSVGETQVKKKRGGIYESSGLSIGTRKKRNDFRENGWFIWRNYIGNNSYTVQYL